MFQYPAWSNLLRDVANTSGHTDCSADGARKLALLLEPEITLGRQPERRPRVLDNLTLCWIDNRKELKQLADAIRRQDPNAASRVEVMSGGEVLGTALIAWLKEEGDNIGIAREVLEVVWPTDLFRTSSNPSRLDNILWNEDGSHPGN